MKTAVINNKEALVQGQMQPLGRALGAGGPGTGPIMHGPILTFLPGLNLVDAKQLAELRQNEMFERNFTNKIPPSTALEQNPEKVGKPILVVMEIETKEGKKPLQLDDQLPIANLRDEKVCKLLIEETLMPDTLHEWMSAEQRPGIRLLIDKQLEAIGSGTKTAGPAGVGR